MRGFSDVVCTSCSITDITVVFPYTNNVGHTYCATWDARQLSPKSLSSFFYDTLYCAITSMKVMLRVSGERTSIFRIIISMFRGILNTRDSEFYWNRVFVFKSPSGEPQFPNLKVSFFLCHSVMHPPKDFSATSKTRNLRKKMVYTTNLLMH